MSLHRKFPTVTVRTRFATGAEISFRALIAKCVIVILGTKTNTRVKSA